MCRQVGLILGRKRRRFPEPDILLDIFTELLFRSEAGGPHATGLAILRRDGRHVLLKRPLPAHQFIDQPAFFAALARFDGQATAILGHNRWPTCGSEQNHRNNHPLRAGRVIGTHNGIITNADALFRAYGLRRRAEVDSELLVRLADLAVGADGAIEPAAFLRLVEPCRGQISAILAAVGAPGRVVVLKGNKPLDFRYSRRHRAVAYATDAAVLDDALATSYRGGHDWLPLAVAPMTMLVFDQDDLFHPAAYRLQFLANAVPFVAITAGITP